MAPSSALPIGATRVVSEMQPIPVDPGTPGSGLANSVLALLSPPNPDEAERYDEEILDLTVVGFLVMYVFSTSMPPSLYSPSPFVGEIDADTHLADHIDSAIFFSTALDPVKRTMTVLGPGQQSFSGKTAIVGSLEWSDPA